MNKSISDFIWDKNFWLPNNFDWEQIQIYNKFSLTHILAVPLTTAFILYIIRIIFERFIARPLGKLIGLKEELKSKFKPNEILEKYFNSKHTPTEAFYIHIAYETGIGRDDVIEWFRLRRIINKPSLLQKFTESCWRCVFYTSIWLYGAFILYNKSWTWDTKECWIDYPKHKITNDVYWYYMIELGFYMSLFVTQFFDIKRKDFWQMFLHHVVTISLIMFSYTCNFIRLGTLVLLIHDCADCWLEFSKMATYAKYRNICDRTFVVFALTWFLTRLVAFPIKILYSTTVEAPKLIGPFPAYYLFNTLLYILQVMHVIWFYMICRIAYKAYKEGDFVDERSEYDDSEDTIDTSNKKSN